MDGESAEVVVIGSGAGGAPLTHTLVRAGHRVVVLEKGPLLRTQAQSPTGLSDFKRDECFATGSEKRITVQGVANTGESYYSSHVEPDLNDEPHVYRDSDGRDRVTIEGYTAQVVGGGTQLYGGVSPRFTPEDLRLATLNASRGDLRDDPGGDVRREARDWPLDYAALEPYYTKAEELVGINGTWEGQAKVPSQDRYQPPLEPNPISAYAAAGMDALGMRRYRTPLAVITRDHAPSGRTVPADTDTIKTAFVNRYGDPLGLKSNAWVSLLAPLRDVNGGGALDLRANCTVTHLEADGPRVTKVHYRDPGGRPRTLTAGTVVVACSAIESVRLLQLSGLLDPAFDKRVNANGLLGRYFLTHCFGGAQCIVPDRSDKSKTLDSDWATDHCARPGWFRAQGLWAGGVIYNNTSDGALPISLARTWHAMDMDNMWKGYLYDTGIVGNGFEDYLEESFGRRLSVAFMANQVPQRENRIELHPSVKDKWGRPVAYIVKTWHPHDRALMDALAEQCRQILVRGGDVRDVSSGSVGGSVVRIANHVLGGARFGADAADSVLDPDCRAWNFDNLYVTDGAFMPTSGSANPTLTIEANSFRVGDALLDRVGRP
ncbi:GMC oxidoreductase [Streptomyces paromomycinus]|uniref:Glucose-methanol-choline oxidoreductase n=1 Tax=Streptomyces paromomycinus TaxID=92743 RepID=A0A401VW22_STREY|nr:GMC family oxidoreductase [Streptomyces paromomycinus]GCD41258.1 glucose-methanol-choline oxidoreductase [Streptomyces paromomycinus]